MPQAGTVKQSVLSRLVKLIAGSQLPGEDPLPADVLESIANVLYASAETRLAGKATLDITSQSDGRRFTRISIINEDMPFLVDSIAATMAAQGLVIDLLVHPVIPVSRDNAGQLQSLGSRTDDALVAESMIYIETARIDARQRGALKRALDVTLGDVRAAVVDWPRMTSAIAADAKSISDPEGAALLQWLGDGMLTQLGHVTRHRDGRHSELLGVCRKSARSLLADNSYERAFAWFDAKGPDAAGHAPLIIKANRISNVHRRVPMDLFIVPRISDGRVLALSVHAGIWTSAALNMPLIEVPRMRRQFAEITKKLRFNPVGHTGKALLHALTELPYDLLIGLDDEDISRVATTMSGLTDRPRPRLTLVEAPLSRHLFVFVWLPRDIVTSETRLGISDLLEEEPGVQILDWSIQIEGSELALLRFVLDIRQCAKVPDEKALDARLQIMLRGWVDAVASALEREEPARAAAMAARYAGAFPTAYRLSYGPSEAALDIARISRLGGSKTDPDSSRRDVRLYVQQGDTAERIRLKIYQHEGQLPLSDAVPALENFGFRVDAEVPTPLDEGRIGTIHDFELVLEIGDAVAPLHGRADDIEGAITAVLNNLSENDPFNRLVTAVGLGMVEVEWLRALYRYLRQTGFAFTVQTVIGALAGASRVTRALIALFRALHDPEVRDRASKTENAREAIRLGLIDVTAINDDRLLRLYHMLIEAVLRTNAFSPAAQEALALKFDSTKVPGLPKPLPWREIFVYSRRVEGIHLRCAPVARGGLRWSDRRDDFRSEILGLMKAQRVKNAVIVPSGAKGGFYPKQLPDPARGRDAWVAEGQASYETFIRSLLSVTDNIVEGKVVHPQGLVILDDDDPYLVVAADKGTGQFSDIANAIAQTQGFWLGDAFASGGSHGYDHKAMGITARGAWVSVRRHFTEMGIDTQKDPVRVIGCGDMSGDVFGNGMLLSKSIRLFAAFDHRHVFIDPDPDPAASWKERRRLFDLAHSSWADYDPKKISGGGGVWSRTAKRIPLSARVRELLGIEAKEIGPDELISAILASPADLLWFGGIGTFVKAADENNIEVGDPANDELRIDASHLRVKVIGEGANLGITQAGRIEFALAGGRINTDFIDNSAGVDCSDNEVNIKIALDAARQAGRLSMKERNALLIKMTDEVSSLVLEDNRLQALALSVAEHGGPQAAAAQIRLIQLLEDNGEIESETMGLADEEALTRRAIENKGLTRPELALLLSSTKLMLQKAIEQNPLADDPWLTDMVLDAFPGLMRERYARQIKEHRLRREIIATKLANRIINRLGMVHPFELAEEEGANLAQVAGAFVIAEKLFDLDALWLQLDTRKMDEGARLLLLDRLATAVRIHMADLLRAGAGRTALNELHQRLQNHVSVLGEHVGALLKPEARRNSQILQTALIEQGAPAAEAAAVARIYDLDGAVGVAQLAVDSRIDPLDLARSFTELGEKLGLDWAQVTAAITNPSDPWERLLVAGLARDLQQVRLDFLRRIARSKKAKGDLAEAVDVWTNDHSSEIRRFRAMIARARTGSTVTPAMLALITSQTRSLFAS